MTKEETTRVLALLKANYANVYKNITPEEAATIVNVWHMQFYKIPLSVVLMALQKSISSSPFPPTIAEIRGKFRKLQIEAEINYNNCNGSEQEREQYKIIADTLRPFFNSNDIEITLSDMIEAIGKDETLKLTGGGNHGKIEK